MKFNFGGVIKQWFNKAEKPEPPAPAPTAPVAVPVPPRSPAKPAPAATAPAIKSSVPGVDIPLTSILAALPLELRPMVLNENVAGLMFTAPANAVLPQLASGSIRIPFGEIRRAAADVFAATPENDSVSVALPLSEILPRLNPALLTRRPSQKQVIVPEEISSPFAGRGTGLSLVVGSNSPQAPTAPAAPQGAAPAPVTPVQRASTAGAVTQLTTPLPGGTDIFQRKVAAANGNGKPPIFPRKPGAPSSNGTEFLQRKTPPPAAPPTPMAEPAPATPIAFRPGAAMPTGPVSPIGPSHAPEPEADEQQIFQRNPALTHTPSKPPQGPAVPATPVSAGIPPRSKDLFAAPPVARAVQPAKPAAVPVAAASEEQTLLVPLAAVSENWPDGVRDEILKVNLVDARLAIPVEVVEDSLKRGRVNFTWKTVRSWIRPGTVPPVSPHDNAELELPLAVLAPLFVARRKANGHQPRVTVSESIPNLFFGLPKPEASEPAKPHETNYFSWNEGGDAPGQGDTEMRSKPGASGGTDLLVKCATPNEIVARAAALEGVAGALIALPDGLMVANRIPAEFNGDTLAAFLPHIFSKVSQCTKELRMGELNNLNFTVGNVPWKIFRVNAIFFAAFGRPGEGLPTADLTALAVELDRKRT